MIPPFVQSARQIDSQVPSNLHRPEKASEIFDSPPVIMQTDQAVKNDAIYRERTVLIKKTTKFFPREIISEILGYIPRSAGEFISKEYDTPALDKWKKKQEPNVKEFVGLTHEEQSCILNSSKSYRGLVEAINRNKLPLIELGFTFEELKNFLSFRPDLRYVDFRGYNPQLINDEFMLDFLDHCENVHTLKIPNSPITDLTILKIARLKNLVKLNLSGCQNITLRRKNAAGEDCSIDLPSSLEHLNLKYCQKITDQSLTNLPLYLLVLNLEDTSIERFVNFPATILWLSLKRSSFVCNSETVFPESLIYLDLGFCAITEETSFKTLPKTITHLDLQETEITGIILKQIPNSVTHLNLSGCVFVSDEWCQNLPSNLIILQTPDLHLKDKDVGFLPRTIEKLIINVENITDSGIAHLPPFLRSLKLINPAITSNGYASLPVSLETLKIEGGTFDDISAAKIPRRISKLEIHRSEITDEGLICLPEFLRVLKASMCLNLSDEGIKYLPRKLAILDLSGCLNITDEGIKDLPPNLVKLYLDYCTKISSSSFSFLPRNLLRLSLRDLPDLKAENAAKLPKNIYFLSLSGNQITDEFLSYLPKEVECLSIGLTTNVTNESFKNLPPKLRYLRLTGIENLTDDCFHYLPKTLECFFALNCNLNETALKGLPVFQFLKKCFFAKFDEI